MMTPEKLLDISTAAKRLNCCMSNVYNLVKDGRIIGVRIGRRAGLRVTESSLLRFIESQTIDPDEFFE